MPFALAEALTVKMSPKKPEPTWYGESETTSFYRATHGSEAITEDEEKYINAMIPPKDYNRVYARFGYALGRKNLSGIVNLSDGNYPLANAQVAQPAVRSNQRNTMFAIGYDWNPSRLELEYLWTKSFIYGPNPVISTSCTHNVFACYCFRPSLDGQSLLGLSRVC
jgi:hypothetical protein